jgi:hypothetical protein
MNEEEKRILRELAAESNNDEYKRRAEEALKKSSSESKKVNTPKTTDYTSSLRSLVEASAKQDYAPDADYGLLNMLETYNKVKQSAKPDTSPLTNLVNTGFELAKNSMEDYYKEQSYLLSVVNEEMGISGELSEDFREQVSAAQPALLQMGVSFKDLTESSKRLVDDTGRFALVGTDMLVRAGEISQAYGMNMSDIIGAYADFEKVGIGAADAQEAIADAGKRSLEVGIQSRNTIKGITENIGKLNEYGFQNGVEGLEKMVRRASEVRMSLQTVFNVADKVFDPEGALDLAANLQVLGGAFGEFNDPLRLMYMATNEVEGLQGAIEGVAQNLATYNVETGGFEVTGANLRMARDIAKQFGIEVGEVNRIAVATQERMAAATSLAGLDIDEKQVEFLTNIARMKDGKMSIELMTPKLQEKFGAAAIALEDINAETAKTLLEYQDDFKELTESDLVRKQVTLTENIERDLSYLVTLARLEAANVSDKALQAFVGEDFKSIGQSLSISSKDVSTELGDAMKGYSKEIQKELSAAFKNLGLGDKETKTSNNSTVSGNVTVTHNTTSAMGAVEREMFQNPQKWNEGLSLGDRNLLSTTIKIQ